MVGASRQEARADALKRCSISPSRAPSLLATDQWHLPPGGLAAMGNACPGWAGREVYTTLPALLSMARAPFISAVRNGAQENVAG